MMKDVLKSLNKAKINLDEYTVEVLNDMEKAKLKQSLRTSIRTSKQKFYSPKKKWMVACLALILIGVSSTAIAAKINVVGYDFEYLLDANKDSFMDYKSIINKTVYDNGVYVKLNEVMIDNNQLLISTTFQFDKPLFEKANAHFIYPNAKIYSNGKLLGKGRGGSLKSVTDTQFIGLLKYDLNEEDLPKDNFHVKIVFSSLEGHGLEKKVEIKGKWAFEFDTNCKQLIGDMKTIPINKTFMIEDTQKVTLSNMELTRITTVINFITDKTDYEVEFKVEDNLGNVYSPQRLHVNFEEQNKGTMTLDPIKEGATQLIITPYFARKSEQSGKGPDYTRLKNTQYRVNLTKSNII
ncbi:MAG: DUF4179 domain-containing protein [Cellulosilyticaceae bacterium]